MTADDRPPRGGRKSDTMAAAKPLRELGVKTGPPSELSAGKGRGAREEVDSHQEGRGAAPQGPVTAKTLAEGIPQKKRSDTGPFAEEALGPALSEPNDLLGDAVDSDTLPATDAISGRAAAIVRSGGMAVSRESPIGRIIAGRYTILEPLGKGGMSEVYVARHELLKKTVAIKVLKEELASSKAALERFHREAIAAAAIGDPHIVDVTDYGFTDDGDAFIVMERLEGSDLRVLLRQEGALSAGRAVAIARQILRGLRAAHACDIIHRDLKAENVFLTSHEDQEFVKLLDFGISKLRSPLEGVEEGKVSLTSTGMVMGTPQYIAPEQAHARSDLDHRVDIYAMGVILYEMLTGDLPFSGDTALELMMKHVQDVPEPPRRRRPDLAISERLEAVVLKALEKDRDERFGSAQEMLDALPGSNDLTGGYASIGTARAPLVRAGGTAWPAILVGLALLLVGGGYFAFRLLAPVGEVSSSSTLSSSPRPEKVVSGGVAGAVHDAGASLESLRLRADVLPGKAAASRPRGDPRSLPRGRFSDAGRAFGSDAHPQNSQAVSAILRIAVYPKHAHIEVDGRPLGRDGVFRGPTGRHVRVSARAKGYRRLTRTLTLRGDRALTLRLRRARFSGSKAEPEGDLKSNPYQ